MKLPGPGPSCRQKFERPDAPEWYQLALDDYGMTELMSDGGLNPRVRRMFEHTRFPLHLVNEKTSWCAAAACRWIEEAGYVSPHSASAAAFMSYGDHSDWKIGAFILIPREGGSGYHVTQYAGDAPHHMFWGLGGNQRNGVLPALYAKAHAVAKRWPNKKL